MRNATVALALACGLLGVCCVSCGESQEFSGWLSTGYQETSLEEAVNLTGVPIPTYLPEGYEIQEVLIETFHKERPQYNEVVLLVSDKEIEKRVSARTNAEDSYKGYDYKCKMEIDVRWTEDGGPGKPPCGEIDQDCKLVHMNGGGWLVVRGDSRVFFFYPSGAKPGFQIVITAGKGLPEGELLKVAESMNYLA